MSHALISPVLRALGGIYSLAWTLARPVLRRNRRLGDNFAERLVPPGWLDTPVDLWIQAASGGEARLVEALLGGLRDALEPGTRLSVLLTTWTRQGRDILNAEVARHAGGPVTATARFVPLDDPVLMRRAVLLARPRLAVLLETELWPGMLLACAESGIPVAVLNGRMRAVTARRYRMAATLWRTLAPAYVAAIAPDDAGRFAASFPSARIEVVPNIKFDQAAPPMQPVQPDPAAALRAFLPDQNAPCRTILFASVREEEEDTLCAALLHWHKRSPLFAVKGEATPPGSARLIIAPRHMHRIAAWRGRLDAMGMAYHLRSALSPCSPSGQAGQTDAILWDAFGELPGLYALADAVFVGGSLAPLGGQNFLEPLAAGVVPFVGPHTSNFAWALGSTKGGESSLASLGLVRTVPDAETLCMELSATKPLRDEDRSAVRERFAAWLTPRRGGSALLATRIMELACRLK